MGRFLQLVWMAALLVTGWADAWSVGSPRSSATIHRRHSQTTRSAKTPRILLQMAAGQDKQRDASRSGTKRERLDKLAELEDTRVGTDKGFVLKAAGAFVGLLAILLVVAFATVEGPI